METDVPEPEGMSDVTEEISQWDTSEESHLARALGGVRIKVLLYLVSDNKAEGTEVKNLLQISTTLKRHPQPSGSTSLRVELM